MRDISLKTERFSVS